MQVFFFYQEINKVLPPPLPLLGAVFSLLLGLEKVRQVSEPEL